MLSEHLSFRWLRTIFLAGALGGVAYFGIPGMEAKDKAAEPSKVTQAIVSTIAPTSTVPNVHVRLGVSVPSAAQDRAFSVVIPGGRLTEERVATGWRAASLAAVSGFSLEPMKDGAFKLLSKDGWSAVLRQKNGAPYQDVTLLGAFDATHAALFARSSDRVILSVGKTGEIRELTQLPELMEPVGFSGGVAWLATFQPGEGLESPPSGPSNLHRVGLDGVMAPVVSDSSMIVHVVAASPGTYAYALDEGAFIARREDARFRGEGRPLVWLDAKTLLYARGTTLWHVDITAASSTELTTLPLAPVAAVVE